MKIAKLITQRIHAKKTKKDYVKGVILTDDDSVFTFFVPADDTTFDKIDDCMYGDYILRKVSYKQGLLCIGEDISILLDIII